MAASSATLSLGAAGTAADARTLDSAFDRLAGATALAAAAVGLVYSVSFVVLNNDVLTASTLLVGGLLSIPAQVAVYERLRAAEPSFALLALVAALAGALGSAVHGGYNLSNALYPPATLNVDLPSEINPRGLLTFGLTGLGVLLLAGLMARGVGGFPRGLGYLGYVLGALLVVVYLARLIVLSPTSPLLLGPALLAGFVANPLWYAWLGVWLWRR